MRVSRSSLNLTIFDQLVTRLRKHLEYSDCESSGLFYFKSISICTARNCYTPTIASFCMSSSVLAASSFFPEQTKLPSPLILHVTTNFVAEADVSNGRFLFCFFVFNRALVKILHFVLLCPHWSPVPQIPEVLPEVRILTSKTSSQLSVNPDNPIVIFGVLRFCFSLDLLDLSTSVTTGQPWLQP